MGVFAQTNDTAVMVPKTKTLFISYRSSDAPIVDRIARDLRLLTYPDDSPRYAPWQDKHNLPPASPNWWDAIVDAIIACDVFVFFVSRASLQSPVCLGELDYAQRRNRPIVPVVLPGEYYLDAESGRYNIRYWDLVPEWLRDVQFLFYTGASFYGEFQTAIALFERNWPPDINIPRPQNPDPNSVHGSNHAVYDTACDYALRLAFQDAENTFRTLLKRNDPDYAGIAAEWIELLVRYEELVEIDQRPTVQFLFTTKWAAYEALFPKIFWQGVFDPLGLREKLLDEEAQARKEREEQARLEREEAARKEREEQARLEREEAARKAREEQARLEREEAARKAREAKARKAREAKARKEREAKARWEQEQREEQARKEREAKARREQEQREEQARKRTPSTDLLPAPFAWIEIAGGRGTMKTDETNVTLQIPTERYWMAKYPVTNAQYRAFVQAGGYTTERWWTPEGWQKCQEGWHYDGGWKPSGKPWTEPRYWNDSRFKGATQPVVGVSWYEAAAFCLWLREASGEPITLPTEAQWQYAAQGTDSRTYPWGNKWDNTRCNNGRGYGLFGVLGKPAGHGERTTPVTAYESRGDSPFGVVDMAGNVWEWCLTDSETGTNDVFETDVSRRVLRGGSWLSYSEVNFRCGYRNRYDPHHWLNGLGFRVVRS